ncbi:tryptophan synthase, alpha subunit [Acetoanaerobium sticklandii]|uniref:Tryptophan synthase alpha chain n=1 Tax=Acetoanaerobium sticklandii (strain ATCC 12662 / DSM 519 / JCM 1433 / CCUG 9281 / NCIMB 10654 / HF) TaxID=499177 RepID=E3PTA4_ACESD|nr:tryptophan synthase subunit alpha [Acetoanaerobium sticklandii]CBH22108.1 tryptophan synthase, alpha subunit [Acetoanaerobium sticklandii]
MNNIERVFKNKKAFIPFITCADPNLETTREIIFELVKNGADIIELGIPFSDPTAEGEVIQSANTRALLNGVTTDEILDFVQEVKKNLSTVLVFMTYANVIFSYGAEKFIKRCSEIGIEGIIVPDLPYEEKNEFYPFCKKYEVNLISMIAPTSEDRISMIAKEAEGFLYIVSSMGVTGERTNITTDLEKIINIAKLNKDIPCAVGFGISTPSQVSKILEIADGVIVGSAIVKIIEKHSINSAKYVGEFVKQMKSEIK